MLFVFELLREVDLPEESLELSAEGSSSVIRHHRLFFLLLVHLAVLLSAALDSVLHQRVKPIQEIQFDESLQLAPKQIQHITKFFAHLSGLSDGLVASLFLIAERINEFLQVESCLLMTTLHQPTIDEHHAQVVDAVQHVQRAFALHTEWGRQRTAFLQAKVLPLAQASRAVFFECKQCLLNFSVVASTHETIILHHYIAESAYGIPLVRGTFEKI